MSPVEIIRALRRVALSPRTVLVGVVIGFGALCVLGRQAALENGHPGFVRFSRHTSPETKYYPTVNEMMAIVRAKIKPQQILVVVGGNSVLRGVAQLPEQIWTKHLQENLGDGYCVANLAFNSSLITDGAAVAAEALRQEFPRQIYIANAAPGQPPTPGGSGVYRWVFWDAYYKGLLIDDAPRAKAVAANVVDPNYSAGFKELRISAWLDHWFYFNDFWNQVTYERFNTVWNPFTLGPTRFLTPRKKMEDPEPDGTAWTLEQRYNPATIEVELINVRGCSQFAFNKDAAGVWQIYAPVWDLFTAGIKDVFPPSLKKRTLILISGSSPYYLVRLTDDERYRDKITYDMAVQQWEEGGYRALTYGRDFSQRDYFDRTHLTATGGAKLAVMTAAKIKIMAVELGYIPAP